MRARTGLVAIALIIQISHEQIGYFGTKYRTKTEWLAIAAVWRY